MLFCPGNRPLQQRVAGRNRRQPPAPDASSSQRGSGTTRANKVFGSNTPQAAPAPRAQKPPKARQEVHTIHHALQHTVTQSRQMLYLHASESQVSAEVIKPGIFSSTTAQSANTIRAPLLLHKQRARHGVARFSCDTHVDTLSNTAQRRGQTHSAGATVRRDNWLHCVQACTSKQIE